MESEQFEPPTRGEIDDLIAQCALSVNTWKGNAEYRRRLEVELFGRRPIRRRGSDTLLGACAYQYSNLPSYIISAILKRILSLMFFDISE